MKICRIQKNCVPLRSISEEITREGRLHLSKKQVFCIRFALSLHHILTIGI